MVSISDVGPGDEDDGYEAMPSIPPDVTEDEPPEQIPNDDESTMSQLFSDEEVEIEEEDVNELDQLVERFVHHGEFNGFLNQEVSRIIDNCVQHMNDRISALHSSMNPSPRPFATIMLNRIIQ